MRENRKREKIRYLHGLLLSFFADSHGRAISISFVLGQDGYQNKSLVSGFMEFVLMALLDIDFKATCTLLMNNCSISYEISWYIIRIQYSYIISSEVELTYTNIKIL